MNKHYLTNTKGRDSIRREKDPIPWRYCLATLACGIVLVGGFFLAARTHFNSIDFGIRNSSLKKQLEDLEAEKRRLIWVRETALSPSEIKKAARKLGYTENTAAAFASFVESRQPSPAASNDEPKVVKAGAVQKDGPKQLVQKTVDVKPVAASKTGATAANAAKKEVSRVQIARN